ncbi:MAG TPA: 4'-phosphopantetheinyl transferase superfamily protein [Nannocystaceae bacterium]|nr:4'-phosphopantetheinyl transferase superfamily protein [Nannocystaceae bacterium]
MIGLDVVEVARMERLLARTPEFARYFTAAERSACASARRPAERWALCFAVKEALLKSLGTGVLGSIPLRDIEVSIGERGAVELVAHGEARLALADRRAWASAVVRAGKAWATVVIER